MSLATETSFSPPPATVSVNDRRRHGFRSSRSSAKSERIRGGKSPRWESDRPRPIVCKNLVALSKTKCPRTAREDTEPYTGINDAGYSINLRSFERLLTGDFYDGTIHFHLCAYFLQLCCQCRDCCFQFLNFAMLFKKLIE